MNEFVNHRCFFLNRLIYEHKHSIKKDKGKVVKDTIYNANNEVIKKCYFYYMVYKQDFIIIKENIFDYRIKEKRSIIYKINYKERTERQIYYDKDKFIFLDLKFYFDNHNNLTRVDEYENSQCKGFLLLQDYKGNKLKTDGYYFPVKFINKIRHFFIVFSYKLIILNNTLSGN